MKTKILLVLFALTLAGCVGTHFKWDTARQIKVGMTIDQVTELMGKPDSIATGASDVELWAWNYGTAWGTGGYFRIGIKDGKVVDVPKISDSL